VPTDGTGLPFDGSGDFGASPFFGQLSDKQFTRPRQYATPFPFQHLMNNFRFGSNNWALLVTEGRLFCRRLPDNITAPTEVGMLVQVCAGSLIACKT
jgi:hypothetical protein